LVFNVVQASGSVFSRIARHSAPERRVGASTEGRLAAEDFGAVQAAAIQSQLDADKARDEARRANAAAQRERLAERRLADHRWVRDNSHPAAPHLAGLSPDQFDRQTGRISWPEVLQGEAFNASRRTLEQLAADRSADRDAAKSGNSEMCKLIEEIKNQLREQITEMPCTEYIAARKFLDALANELRSEDTKPELAADRRGSSDRG
jgi:hypothetical protein